MAKASCGWRERKQSADHPRSFILARRVGNLLFPFPPPAAELMMTWNFNFPQRVLGIGNPRKIFPENGLWEKGSQRSRLYLEG
jgi:hypothetical protein